MMFDSAICIQSKWPNHIVKCKLFNATNKIRVFFVRKPQFDFAASFSSIEHSGLGRYGDPIDPFGDIREMEKVSCLLKKGGLFFVGFPVGADVLVYNLHRIYGPIRLPMMFAGLYNSYKI